MVTENQKYTVKPMYLMSEIITEANLILTQATKRLDDFKQIVLADLLLDENTVIYYRSLGLFQKAVEYKNKIAKYDFFNIIQLCLIKYLQQQKQSLGKIQKSGLLTQRDKAIEAFEFLFQIELFIEDEKVDQSNDQVNQLLNDLDEKSVNTLLSHPTTWTTLELMPNVMLTFKDQAHPKMQEIVWLMKKVIQQIDKE
jgi:hypothetical protein